MTFDPANLRGVHLVPLTAFDTKNRINEELQAQHIRNMYNAGVRIYMPGAGTSEFQNLSLDEVVTLVRLTRENSGPDAQIFAPVGMQVQHSIDIGRRSLEVGATGIMFMPFVHPYLSNEGARDYYLTIIEATACPVLIYKKSAIPSDALLLELADNEHLVGIKHATNEMHEFRKVIKADGGRIEWICGSAERFAPYYMLAGAPGFTTGAGNLCPHLSLACHAAFAAGQWEEGMRLQGIIQPIEDFRARSGDSYNVSMLKYAMSLIGPDFGPGRPPQRRLTDQDRSQIDTLMQPILAVEAEIKADAQSVGLSR